MFEIGWSELLLIGIVALIAIGPKELPTVLRTLGQWMSKLRRMASEFQSQFQEAMREAEMADLKKQVDEMTSQAQSYANFDPVSEVRRELESTQQQIESAMVNPTDAATPSPPVAAEPDTSPVDAAPPATDAAAPSPAVAPSTDAAAPSPAAAPEPATADVDAAKPDGKPA
jgi:sec-independent protein translocase protein TatB